MSFMLRVCVLRTVIIIVLVFSSSRFFHLLSHTLSFLFLFPFHFPHTFYSLTLSFFLTLVHSFFFFFVDSGSFTTKGHRPCLGPRSIGSSNTYSTAQGEVKTKGTYSNTSSFRNSVLWCWSSRMTKLILCSFAFALVPSVTFKTANNEKVDDNLIEREVKVQSDSFTSSYGKSHDQTTQEDHSTSFTTGIQVRMLMTTLNALLLHLC